MWAQRQLQLLGLMAGKHTYASLCVAAGIPLLQLSRFIYTHLFDDDHAEMMAALEAMSRPVSDPNVVPMRRPG